MSGGSRAVYIGVACAIAGAIGFSGKTVIVKLAYRYGVDALTLLALRMMFALPLLLLMAWWAGFPAKPLSRRDILVLFGLGLTGYSIGSYLDLAGLQYISAGMGRLILYLYPTVVLLLSAAFLKQPIRPRHMVSLLLSYAGICVVFSAEIAPAMDLKPVFLGSALVFGSAVTYAVYLIAASGIVQKLGSMRTTAYASTLASLFVIGAFLASHGVHHLRVPAEVYGLTVLLSVFSTVLPLWLTAEALKRIGANQLSLLGCIGPVSTIALGAIFLDEAITLLQIAGAGLVLCGILIISLKPEARSA